VSRRRVETERRLVQEQDLGVPHESGAEEHPTGEAGRKGAERTVEQLGHVHLLRRVTGGGPPLLDAVRLHEEAFRTARAAADAPGMVAALLALDDELWAWSADTLQSDALDRGRASLRAMVAELGELAELGARDPAGVVGPFVELALALRDAARRERRFADADGVRDGLVALGVEINDTPEGSTWRLPDADTAG